MPRFRAAIRILQLSFAFALLVTASPSLAQVKGTISGRITDKKTGHAIPFASVNIPEAKAGAMSNSEGDYVVKVPAGTYEVKVQFLGYIAQSKPGVVVTGDKPVVVNFQ